MNPEIHHLPSSMVEILANTDKTDLRVWWYHPRVYLELDGISLERGQVRSHEKSVKLANYMFALTDIYVEGKPVSNSRAFIKRLAPRIEVDAETPGHVILSANTVALFGLPGENPLDELKEVKGLFTAIKDSFSLFYNQNMDNDTEVAIQFFNHSAPVKESVQFVRIKEDNTAYADIMERQKRIHRMISESPVLGAFVQHIRRILNSIGSRAWMTLTDDKFFEMCEAPSYIRQINRPVVSNTGKPAVKPPSPSFW